VQGTDLLQRRVPPFVYWAIPILAAILAGGWLQSQVHLNHDVSYFVHFSRWLLQGRTLGVDLHDGNLPMVWGLFMPSAALVQAGLMDESSAVRAVFWAYFLISTAMLIHLLSRMRGEQLVAGAGWVTAFVLVATLAPGFSFGQREHACVLFAMPYLAAASLRLQGVQDLNKIVAVFVGVLAGIGFALKPYFLAVPALVELTLLIVLGGRSLLGRMESLAFGCTVLAYVVAALLTIPDYLQFTIGLTRYTYWAYSTGNYPALFARYLHVVQPALFGLAIAGMTRTWSWQHNILLLACVGYTASYFVQAKGFVYHGYPLLVCAVAFLGLCLAHGVARMWSRRRHEQSGRVAVLIAALAVVLTLLPVKQVLDDTLRWYSTYNIAHGPTGRFRQAVIDTVNYFAPTRRSYFFAFSTHPFPGFPTASYTAADWTGRSMVQSFIPAYARLDEVTDAVVRQGVLGAADYQRRAVIEDFERRPPTIVFAEANVARLGMNGRRFDDIAFYQADPRFQRIWAQFTEVRSLGPLRVFVRRDIAQALGVDASGDAPSVAPSSPEP
jgi:hypothetical protein